MIDGPRCASTTIPTSSVAISARPVWLKRVRENNKTIMELEKAKNAQSGPAPPSPRKEPLAGARPCGNVAAFRVRRLRAIVSARLG